MSNRYVWFAWLAMGLLSVSTAQAQINGLVNRPRVFNDHPTSTLTMVNSNSLNPGTATINDLFTEGTPGGANRHDVSLSSDGGATAHIFDIGDTFTFKAEVNLTDLTNSPRKEAGLRLDSSPASGVGDAQFFVNSDAGEIVALGGGGPFHLFGNNGGGNGYTPGTTILMGITYTGKAGATPATIEYFIDRGAGLETSGPQPYTNLELGAVDFRASFYAQGAPSAAGDFVNGAFNNIMFSIPEPTTFVLLGLALVGLTGIRRRSK